VEALRDHEHDDPEGQRDCSDPGGDRVVTSALSNGGFPSVYRLLLPGWLRRLTSPLHPRHDAPLGGPASTSENTPSRTFVNKARRRAEGETINPGPATLAA
jgi:hypothetical protein